MRVNVRHKIVRTTGNHLMEKACLWKGKDDQPEGQRCKRKCVCVYVLRDRQIHTQSNYRGIVVFFLNCF